MTDAFLPSAKFHIPFPRSRLVSRPRLVERLNEGLDLGRRMTLISSSAGSGKTTLLGEWAASGGRPFCWLSLDEDDNDPRRFWSCVISALGTVRPGIGQSVLPLLRGSKTPATRSFLATLLNEAAEIPEPIVLVLDDYHFIIHEAVLEGVAFLLDHCPDQLHLAVATRVDPLLPVARLRARGQLTELRADELSFTLEEAAAFLNDAMGLNLSREDIAALETRTEGWIAGLGLAAQALRKCPDAHAFVEAFGGNQRYILEYLIEEVPNRQSETIQGFLLRTCILDNFCAPLCDALTGGSAAAEILELLRKDNLFLVPLDDAGLWYRYHRLFGDLLRNRLERSSASEVIRDLHRRASRWHAERGMLEQAVKHARSSEDFEGIAGMVERAVGESLLDARFTTLLRWTEELPEETLDRHPLLRIYRTWALFLNGRLDAAWKAMRESREAIQAMPASTDNDGRRRSWIRLLDTMELIAGGLVAGLDDRTGDAIRMCERARDMAIEDGWVFLAVHACESLALAQYHQGRLRASARTCQQVLDMTDRLPKPSALGAAACVELAGIHTEWNELKTASGLLDKALRLCHDCGVVQTMAEAYTALSRLLAAREDAEGAREELGKAGEYAALEGNSSLTVFRIAIQQARLHLKAGDPGAAIDWAEDMKTSMGSGGTKPPAAFVETLAMIRARACLAQGRAREALAFLSPLLSSAQAAGSHLLVIEALALEALARRTLGETDSSLDALERSLSLAAPEGFARIYLDEGAPMAGLLREAVSRGIQADYSARLLRWFDAAESGSAAAAVSSVGSGNRTLADPLSSREIEVLRLIAAGLSNEEIGDRLFIALNTVKRHAGNIFGKLDAKSRTGAVARARALGLLS